MPTMPPRLLHGTLSATIFGTQKLHIGFPALCGKGSGKKMLNHVKQLVLCQSQIGGSKIYATVDLDKARVGRTRIVGQPSQPQWNEQFRIYCAHWISRVVFTIKNNDIIGATLIGRAYIPVEDIIGGYEVQRLVPILDEDHNPIEGGAKLHVKLQFLSVSYDPNSNWSQGIKSPQFPGVPCTFFNQRSGNKVSLYQDAHVLNNSITPILLSEGRYREDNRCWEDIFDAISNAKHLVYITGWSVHAKIKLIRDLSRPKPGGDLTLGELLKKKANVDGVTVLLLVWDDRTSLKEFKRDGLMVTHDEGTADYFRNSKVKCVLCPRNPDGGRSFIQGFEIAAMFTHHQKTVVVDSEVPGRGGGGLERKRRIISFVGGIDLCDGRYDTPEHPIFSTLDTVHRYDFHQPNFPKSSIDKGGPREPWHDIHCRLEGPVAWDVLYNFEQRWLKQVGTSSLIPLAKLNEFITRPSEILPPNDPETWNVQIFRSIDGGAATGFPINPEQAIHYGLVTGKDNVIDRSIQDAYINAIRRAKDFIYIENQYFIGSSFGWNHSVDTRVDDINALHLIPKELSLKIVSKIEAGERFSVYVVIPMWPEGIPESDSVQAILDWQRRTMEMMYSDISQALQRKGLDSAHPKDYLSFFCLGNRESPKTGEYTPTGKPEPNSDYIRAQKARRFMIYVHAKMMIVDDEYIIIGSANINQRSMDGGRDTEIAMGAFQPHHLSMPEKPASGEIYGFRTALWYEHLHTVDPIFKHPESLACMQLVNMLAHDSWDIYIENKEPLDIDLHRHLLPYPIEVTQSGGIATLPGFEFFPDTKAKVLGTHSEFLPPILTT